MSGVALGVTAAGAAVNAGMSYSQQKAAAKAGTSKPDYTRAAAFGFLGPKFAGDYYAGRTTGALAPLQQMAFDQVKKASPWNALLSAPTGSRGIGYGSLFAAAPTTASKISEVLTNNKITAPSTFADAMGAIRGAPMGQETKMVAPSPWATAGTAAATGAMQYGTLKAGQAAEDERWKRLYPTTTQQYGIGGQTPSDR